MESVFTGNRNVGSNPTPSASKSLTPCTFPDLREYLYEMRRNVRALARGPNRTAKERRRGEPRSTPFRGIFSGARWRSPDSLRQLQTILTRARESIERDRCVCVERCEHTRDPLVSGRRRRIGRSPALRLRAVAEAVSHLQSVRLMFVQAFMRSTLRRPQNRLASGSPDG